MVLDMRYTRGESGKETSSSQTLRNWNRWTHRKSMQKTQRKGSVNAHEWWKIIFPIAKLSGGDEVLRTSTLILDRSDRGEEKRNLQGESKRVFLQFHFEIHRCMKRAMMMKLKVTSGLLQDNSFIVITMNLDFNSTCRLKNHSLIHWNASKLPEQHVHHLTYCWRKYWRWQFIFRHHVEPRV